MSMSGFKGVEVALIVVTLVCMHFIGRIKPRMYIVDRIEENLVVVEWDGGHFKIPKELFSLPVKEGDILKISIDIDSEATKNRVKRIQQLLEFDEY